MTTAISTTTRHDAHDNEEHVEQAGRLYAIHAAIERAGLRDDLLALPERLATVAELTRAHHLSMVQFVEHAGTRGGWIEQDTYVCNGSWDAALAAAGAALAATDAVLDGVATNAFALARPPGHHATHMRPMGFCLLNNVAVAAQHALARGVARIAIVDFDVHHGNGTQDIFYENDRVLFCSSHGGQIYPGTGATDEVGEGAAAGLTFNAPLPFGVGDQGIQLLYEQALFPAIRAFKPELLLVSAGYDAHWADPIGTLAISDAGFAWLTKQLLAIAAEHCKDRAVFVLEGGYDVNALGQSVVTTLNVMLARDPQARGVTLTRPEPDLRPLIARLQRQHPLLGG